MKELPTMPKIDGKAGNPLSVAPDGAIFIVHRL